MGHGLNEGTTNQDANKVPLPGRGMASNERTKGRQNEKLQISICRLKHERNEQFCYNFLLGQNQNQDSGDLFTLETAVGIQ